MIRSLLWILSITGMLLLGMGPRRADAEQAIVSSEAACSALMQTDFTGLEDAPTKIVKAQLIAAKGSAPEYCQVLGNIWPQVGFELRLPGSGWNGKFIEIGCGGFCGVLFWTFWCPLDRGYACIASDMGHQGAGGSDNNAMWAYQNLQAQIDFGFRGAHVAALAGKAITARYYGRSPKYSYFHGCSSGGQQALSEAQRFPWDFDGILAGAPSPTFSGPMMYYLWAGRALLQGKILQDDLKFVHDKAVARCDLDDGVKDGVIGDPLHCPFSPKELLCAAGQKTGCLSAEKIAAIEKVYSGPLSPKGEKLYTGGPAPGSELNWITDAPGTSYVYGAGVMAPWPVEYFRYAGFMPAPGPRWKPEDFDFDRDYKRLRMSESLFGAADNPDLRKFKAAGGKLILYQGAADESDILSDAVDYYETVEKTMGGRAAVQDFFRLFAVAGMNHCTGGAGAYAIDYLTYLENWVERSQAPDRMIGAHIDDNFIKTGPHKGSPMLLKFPLSAEIPVSFTRPVYPYPGRAVYAGYGNPADAENFKRVP